MGLGRDTSASSAVFCRNDGPGNDQKIKDYLNTLRKRYSQGLAPRFKRHQTSHCAEMDVLPVAQSCLVVHQDYYLLPALYHGGCQLCLPINALVHLVPPIKALSFYGTLMLPVYEASEGLQSPLHHLENYQLQEHARGSRRRVLYSFRLLQWIQHRHIYLFRFFQATLAIQLTLTNLTYPAMLSANLLFSYSLPFPEGDT